MTPGKLNPWSAPRLQVASARRIGLWCILGGALLMLLATTGCKGSGGGGGSSSGTRDPLVYNNPRIPPPNVPVYERGTAGGRGKSDPLISTPTGGGPRTGAGYVEDPERFRGAPFVPNAGSVPASLAGRNRDGDELKIDTGAGVPLRPTGGTVPMADLEAGAEMDRLLSELRGHGVSRDDYYFRKSGGRVTFTARVPVSATGAVRQFTGEGANASDAVRQVLDQIKTTGN